MQRPFIIGVTGGSGSGKTSLLSKLRSAFQRSEVAIITQDNYYRKREEQLVDEEGKRNFDLPESIELETFNADLKRLSDGGIIERTEYTYNNELIKPSTVTIHPAPIIIAEGLFLMHVEEVRKRLNLTVFVDVSDVLKLKRRIIRDQAERNYPLEDVLYRYEHHVLPSYQKYILPYRDHADIIINNTESLDGGLEVLRGYIQSMLSSGA